MADPEYDPLDPQIVSNPHPIYHRLRSEDPVHWSAMLEAWVPTRYEDVAAVLAGARFSADRRKAHTRSQESLFGIEEFGAFKRARMIVNTDPPEHTRLRRLVSKAFAARTVEDMRSHIQEIVDGLLDAAEKAGHLDFIKDFAYPLPVTVIAEMLGVSLWDRDDFRRWSSDAAAAAGPVVPPEVMERGRRSIEEMSDFFRRIVQERRREPKEDLISSLVAAEEEGQVLSDDEMLVALMFLLIAGHETTTNLLGNGMLALLRHPDQLQRLRDDLSLVQSAVEELLRLEGPLQATARVATEDIEIGGRKIKEGQLVLTTMAAANRDPTVFPSPDELDLGRHPNEHLAFGHGRHTCLGAALARAEAQIAFSSFLQRFPNARLDIEPHQLEWRGHFAARGLVSLPIAL